MKTFRHDEIVKRIENLKKVINPLEVEMTIRLYKAFVSDANTCLHMVFYHLRGTNLKYRRSSFGRVKNYDEANNIIVKLCDNNYSSFVSTYSPTYTTTTASYFFS